MKCINCGHIMETTQGAYHYSECGLENIRLMNVPIHRCPSCKETEVEIPHSEELHLLIAFILVLKPTALSGKEAQYLRKHLGLTADELAKRMGLTRITVTRWEGRRDILRQHDKHLRLLYLDKNRQELSKIQDVQRIISTLVQSLPLDKKKQEFRIRTEDWVSEQDLVGA